MEEDSLRRPGPCGQPITAGGRAHSACRRRAGPTRHQRRPVRPYSQTQHKSRHLPYTKSSTSRSFNNVMCNLRHIADLRISYNTRAKKNAANDDLMCCQLAPHRSYIFIIKPQNYHEYLQHKSSNTRTHSLGPFRQQCS